MGIPLFRLLLTAAILSVHAPAFSQEKPAAEDEPKSIQLRLKSDIAKLGYLHKEFEGEYNEEAKCDLVHALRETSERITKAKATLGQAMNYDDGMRPGEQAALAGRCMPASSGQPVVASAPVAIPPNVAILLESCNLVPDAAKRLACLKAAVAQNPPPSAKADYELDDVERALQGLVGGIRSGMSYRQYKDAVLGYAKALQIFEARAARDQTAVYILDLHEALDAYNDAGTLWARSSPRDDEFPAQGLEPMVDKYKLPVRKIGLFGQWMGVSVSESLRLIWDRANTMAQRNISFLRTVGPQ